MNAYLFFIHCSVVLSFLITCLYLGKEAVMLFVGICCLFANFFVTKEIILFGCEVTASDMYTIGAMLGLSVIQEYWGKAAARRTIGLSFLLLLFGAVAAFLHLAYTPSPHDTMQPYFEKILSPAPRLIAASLVVFFIVQYLEMALFSFLQRFSKIPFFIRAASTTSCVQMVDTLLFSFLGLYGLVHSLFDICVVSYSIKLLIIALSSPFLALTKYMKYEKIPV